MPQSLLDPARGIHVHDLDCGAFAASIGTLFAFAFVWSIGGVLAAPAARGAFDAFAREQLAPLGADRERLHQLAACLMGGGDAAAAELGSVPAVGTSEARHEVLQRLQASGQWPALPQLGLLLASWPAGCAPLLRCRLAQHTARCRRRRCRTAAGGCAC